MYIEDYVKQQQENEMWGEYHPTTRLKSCVMTKAGCVFIGSIEQCQTYMSKHTAVRGENPALGEV